MNINSNSRIIDLSSCMKKNKRSFKENSIESNNTVDLSICMKSNKPYVVQKEYLGIVDISAAIPNKIKRAFNR